MLLLLVGVWSLALVTPFEQKIKLGLDLYIQLFLFAGFENGFEHNVFKSSARMIIAYRNKVLPVFADVAEIFRCICIQSFIILIEAYNIRIAAGAVEKVGIHQA